MFTSFLDRYPNLALTELGSGSGSHETSVSAPSTDKAMWDHVCRLVEHEKVEVAGAISALKQEFEEQRLDFKDYVSRASREDAAVRISAGKERQKATVAVAELATEVEVVKGEVRKIRGLNQQQENEDFHLLRQRVGTLESKVESLSASMEPFLSRGQGMTGQLERRLQQTLGQMQELLQQGLDIQRQEFNSVLSGELEKLQGDIHCAAEVSSRLQSSLESLSEEMKASLAQQTQKLDATLQQEVRSEVLHDTQELRVEIDAIRRTADDLRQEQKPDQRFKELYSFLHDESSRLHASCASAKKDFDSSLQEVRSEILHDTQELRVEIHGIRHTTDNLRQGQSPHHRLEEMYAHVHGENEKLRASFTSIQNDFNSSLQEVHQSLLGEMQNMRVEIKHTCVAAENASQTLDEKLQQSSTGAAIEASKLQASFAVAQHDLHSKILAVQDETEKIRVELGDMANLLGGQGVLEETVQGLRSLVAEEIEKRRTCAAIMVQDLDSRFQEVKLEVQDQIEHLRQELGPPDMRVELERLGAELGWTGTHTDEAFEAKLQEVHEALQGECTALWAELRKLQSSIPPVVSTVQKLNFRLQDEAGRLSIELDDLRDTTASVEELDSRLAQVQSCSLEEIAQLRIDLNHHKSAILVQGDLDQRIEAVHTRIQEETGRLRAELDVLKGCCGPTRLEVEMDSFVQATQLQLRDETGKLRAELEGVRGGIDAQEKNIAVCMQLVGRDLELRKQDLMLYVQNEVERLRGDLESIGSASGSFRHDLESCKEVLMELQEREDLREAREAAPQVEPAAASAVGEQVRSLDIRLAEVEAVLQAESTRPAIGLLEQRYKSLEQALSLKFGTYDQQLEAFQEASAQASADIASCSQRFSSIERSVAENTQAIERVREDEVPRRDAAHSHDPEFVRAQSTECPLQRMQLGAHDSEILHLRAAQEHMLQRWSLLAGQSDSALREAEKHAREPVGTSAGLQLASANLGEAQVRLLQQCTAVAKGTAVLEARMSEHQRKAMAALREGRSQESPKQEDTRRCADARQVDRSRLERATLLAHQDNIGRTLEVNSCRQLTAETDVDETSSTLSAQVSMVADERPALALREDETVYK